MSDHAGNGGTTRRRPGRQSGHTTGKTTPVTPDSPAPVAGPGGQTPPAPQPQAPQPPAQPQFQPPQPPPGQAAVVTNATVVPHVSPPSSNVATVLAAASGAGSSPAGPAPHNGRGRGGNRPPATPPAPTGAAPSAAAAAAAAKTGIAALDSTSNLKAVADKAAADKGTAKKPVKPAVPAKARKTAQTNRRAHLRLTKLDLLSVLKMSFLFAFCISLVIFVALFVLWQVLEASGAIASVQNMLNSIMGNPDGTTTVELSKFLNSSRVLGFGAGVAVINVFLLTLLGTLFGALYNLAATIFGGLEVTLEV